MEGTAKSQTDKYKEIKNYWNDDASCERTSLPDIDTGNIRRLAFVAQSVPSLASQINTEWNLNFFFAENLY
jgi:hypothetical protein